MADKEKKQVMITANVDAATKKEAEAILASLGLSMTAAINIYLKAVVKSQGIPFPMTTDAAAMDQWKRLHKYGVMIQEQGEQEGIMIDVQ